MRHDQADEAHRAGRRHRERRGDRRCGVQPQALPAHVDTKRLCRQRAARQRVERTRIGQHQQQQQDRAAERGLPAVNTIEIAHQPKQHAAQFVVGCHRENQRDHRAAASGNDDAGEQQTRAAIMPRTLREIVARQAQHQQHRQCGTERGGGMYQQQAGPDQQHRQRPHCRTTRDAHQVRLGQRVAQQHLHQRPGQCQQRTGAKGSQRARQAQVEHDVAARTGIATGERAPYLCRGDCGAPGQQRQRSGRTHRSGQQAKRGDGAGACHWHTTGAGSPRSQTAPAVPN